MSKPSASLKPATKTGSFLNKITNEEKIATQTNFSTTKFKSGFKVPQAKASGMQPPKNRDLIVGYGQGNVGSRQAISINQYKVSNTDNQKKDKVGNLDVKVKVLNSITKKESEPHSKITHTLSSQIKPDYSPIQEIRDTEKKSRQSKVTSCINKFDEEALKIEEKKREAIGLYEKLSKLENRLIVKKKVPHLILFNFNLDS